MRVPLKIIKTILEFPKLKTYLDGNPQARYEVVQNIDELHGSFNHSLVQVSKKFLDKTFLKLYDRLNLTVPEGFNLEQLNKDYHIVLVPNHQSHADYIALTYLFYASFKTPLYIAAGINLNIFPIGSFFKNTGAFFIRRKFNDDEVYKLSFQAYIYYLIKEHKIIEFFFEGGRSRTGKLLSPRYGLFSTILETHKALNSGKPLMFIPVAIAHENLPEEKAHAKELEGKKKVKEKPTQLLKIFSLASRKLGSIHISFQEGVVVKEYDDLKKKTQEIAFSCFRSVGKGMPVTPSSLLAMVLLEESSGALNWTEIRDRSLQILDICQKMEIPISESLDKGEAARSLKRALKNFISNKKIQVLNEDKIGQEYYFPVKKSRVELLYFKNTILHHFLIPYFINIACSEIRAGEIEDADKLTRFLLRRRDDLKYEFYLPSTDETFTDSLTFLSKVFDEDLKNLDEVINLFQRRGEEIESYLSVCAHSFNYILESYFLACLSLEKFKNDEEFSFDKFNSNLKGIYKEEMLHGKNINYPECFIVPVMKNGLRFLDYLGYIEIAEPNKRYKLINRDKVEEVASYLKKELERLNDLKKA